MIEFAADSLDLDLGSELRIIPQRELFVVVVTSWSFLCE